VRKLMIAMGCAVAWAGAQAPAAPAAFPWPPAAPGDFDALHTNAGQVPNDLEGDNVWKFAATAEPGSPHTADPHELFGIRGAHVVDANAGVDTGWRTTTGRPDVTIAVLDSGIRWNSPAAMKDLRLKTRLNKGELPQPLHDRSTPLEGAKPCNQYASADDANGDGVFNVADYACDSRVEQDPAQRGGLGVGPANVLDPQDVLIAFSVGGDDDSNGFVDDIVGWDFLDDDNDPYDDVQYGHGTGEAEGSAAEADNSPGDDDLGTCPNCMVIHMRVGDSFVADASRFAQATIYATDNDALVVQEALGTLNNTSLARDAVQYAYDHGVTVIASAADEAAQHHNYVSSLPHVIVVNSIRRYQEPLTPSSRSYLQFNGCTNFSSKVTLSIPSTSCSSDATGVGSGLAGLVYSAALNAQEAGQLQPHPTCKRADGSACLLTANEVRQLMASGRVGTQLQSDDVDFAEPGPEPSCTPPVPGCTDPNGALQAQVNIRRPVVSPLATTRSYPARGGHDQFYGYGRVNTNRAVKTVVAGNMPPEVEITSPQWFSQVDPGQGSFTVEGQVHARGQQYSCQVFVAPGSYPADDDFDAVPSPGVCDGTARTGAIDGAIAQVDISALKARFPPDAGDFQGRETGQGAGQTSNGRPNVEPYGFVVKVVATTTGASPERSGQDQRNLYLHRDRDLLAGFPRTLPSDGESSPLFVDLDGDNRTELLFATADGIVHAQRPDGSELAGWPASGDQLGLHTGGPAFQSGEVAPRAGSFLASLAGADIDRDGVPEVVGADFEGKVYVWGADGQRIRTLQTNPAFSGAPQQPFVDVRRGKRHRTQRGFIASPVLADLDGDDGGRLEIVAAAMDRHVYAWNDDGTPVPGFPVLVLDWSKVSSVDPVTHVPTFTPEAGDELDQGAIIDTPAVADITGDGKPEIVVGTNEEYKADDDGGWNVGNSVLGPAAALFAQANVDLADANTRVYAIKSVGDPGGPGPSNSDAFIGGWPVRVAKLMSELLPIVGEGVTGAPIVGPASMDCGGNGGQGPKVGVMPDAGPAYVLNQDGSSCLGNGEGGKPNALQTETGAGADHPAIPAVGHPAFGNFAGGISFLAPAAGLIRALDVAVPEYQTGGQDYLGAWNPTSGQFRPGFPARVNDLQFLTGPSVADVDGQPGEEMVGGTAYLDLQAFGATGSPASGDWPKLTSDWMVANPLVGSWSDLDRTVVVASTRSGSLFAYRTGAPPCPPGSWPRFHHDNANSGFYDRDATAPGVPHTPSLSGGVLLFRAPGDDVLCGTIPAGPGGGHFEAVQSDQPITPATFGAGEPLAVPSPSPPGTTQTIPLPPSPRRYAAVRAVDEQGNVGQPLVVDLATGEPVGTNPFAGFPGPGRAGAAVPGGGGPSPPPGGASGPCRDRLAPRAAFARRGVRPRRGGIFLTGTASDRGCGPSGRGRLRRVEVALARVVRGGCRFLTARGRFGPRRSCGRQSFLRAGLTARGAWFFSRRATLPPARYAVVVRALDAAGNRRTIVRRFGLR